ncbi:MAG: HlyD family efflux transporter periplasmic adaptor subunit [Bacteroidia bacterium]
MTRKIVLAVIGVGLIVVAILVARNTISNRKEWRPNSAGKLVTGVFVEKVKNTSSEITITTSGNLRAKNRLELYSEVQGIFNHSSHPFKPGTWYRKGEILLKVDDKEEVIALKAQKSNFYNQLVLLIPDLKLDYPDAAGKWETYVSNFDEEKPLADLPKPDTEKEKLFLSGRNIYTAFYNVKNLETQLINYTIRAPYSGVLTQTLVDQGVLIRPGQKLGEFIDQSVYELEVAVNTAYGDLLSVGKSVKLHNVEKTQTWTGQVIRVNSMVDQASQTIPTFIQVSGKGLREGMYLEADVTAKEEKNTFEVNRKLLIENERLFIVRDSVLDMVNVEPVYFKESTAIVKGLEDGTLLVANALPGAYIGMPVKIYSDDNGAADTSASTQ